jgi:AraC-like DNA-binding protein
MMLPFGALGTFVCPPDADGWDRDVCQRSLHVLAFPAHPVWITFAGAAPILADHTRVMLHRDGQVYRRSPVAGHADRCRYVAVTDDAIREVTAEFDPAASEAASFAFAAPHTRIDAARYYAFQTGVRRALADRDRWRAAEIAMDTVRSIVGTAVASIRGDAPRTRRRTRCGVQATRRALVEAAKEVVTAAVLAGADIGLTEVAARLHVSPFHLTRIFREVTGTPMYRYLTDVRLRAGLDSLLDAEPDTPIATVAHQLGFASHGHFTVSFRALFGVAPSQARAAAKSRKILEAAAPPAL